ncbi:uncharacterized protein V6R79_018893 [Siganus canaliculatus]
MYQGIDIPRSTSRLGHTFDGRRMQRDFSLYFTWIMQLKVTYNPINERNIFTNGDTVTGRVTLEVRNSGRINSLSIKFIVVSRVQWDGDEDPEDTTYHSEEKHFLVQGKHLNYSSVVAPGCYVYPFRFQIPLQDLPASYHSSFGTIQYKLEAKLSRSMKRDKKHETEITFVPRRDLTNNFKLMKPQRMTVNKNLNLFNSGEISMDVKLEKSGFFRGEQLKVVAYIVNNSSRVIKPKYCLYAEQTYFTKYGKRVQTRNLLKEVGEPIPRSASQTVTKVITIPQDAGISILNCPKIKVEYKLRVYLNVKFASNAEILFPVVILLTPQVHAVAPPRGVSGLGAFGSTSRPTHGPVPSALPIYQLPLPPPMNCNPSLTDSDNKYYSSDGL